MSFTHVVTRSYRDSSGNSLVKAESITNNTESTYSDSIPDSTSNAEVDMVLTVANLKSICINSSAAITIKTNSTSSPDDTLVLVAGGQCIVWSLATDGTAKRPLTANTTKFYITNASGGPAQVDIRILADQTP